MAWKPPLEGRKHKERREALLREIGTHFHNQAGVLLFFADFESHGPTPFKQDSSFYYLTGITEPGTVVALHTSGESTLFVPNFGNEREKWVDNAITPKTDHYLYELNKIEYLGAPLHGYQLYPFFSLDTVQELAEHIKEWIESGLKIYTLYPRTAGGYCQQRFFIERLISWIPSLSDAIIDISDIVGNMRRRKDNHELSCMRQAISITIEAQRAALKALVSGSLESDMEAEIDYTYLKRGASRAFPSIVATGINGTVLHYTSNNARLQEGDLVVVDIGAQYGYYCADITRTYPVSGGFTAEQRIVYDIVLKCQSFIAEHAKPGVWLSNRDYPDHSLNHLAKKFLSEKGYGEFFLHGIGHYLGLDVHDVGSYATPLQAGDVITIEPGLYLRDKKFGIRIEDDYLITPNDAECLSAELPKEAEEIEQMIRECREEID